MFCKLLPTRSADATTATKKPNSSTSLIHVHNITISPQRTYVSIEMATDLNINSVYSLLYRVRLHTHLADSQQTEVTSWGMSTQDEHKACRRALLRALSRNLLLGIPAKPEPLHSVALNKLFFITFPEAFVTQNFLLQSLVMSFWRSSPLVGHLTNQNSSVTPADLKISLFTSLLRSLTKISAFAVCIYEVICL